MDTISIIGMLVTAALGFFSNMLFEHFKQQRKLLTYKHGHYLPIAKAESDFKDRVKILYDNKEMKNLYYSGIEFLNDGNTIIENQNVIVKFDKDVAVIEYSVYDDVPDKQNSIGHIEKGTTGEYIFTINYLNPKEKTALLFLSSCDKFIKPEILGRGKGLIIRTSKQYSVWTELRSGLLGAVIGAVAILPIFKYLLNSSWISASIIVIASIVIQVIFFFISKIIKRNNETTN